MLVNSCANSEPARADIPLATIKAYRRTGGAVVTIERVNRQKHRHVVSVRRYRAFTQWTMYGPYSWSGAFGRSAKTMDVSLWAKAR